MNKNSFRWQSILFFVVTILFYSCSMFETSQNASLSFVIDKNMAKKISSVSGTRSVTASSARSLTVQEMEGLYFEISLDGSYKETKIIPVSENAKVIFENIPIGANLHASAKVYRFEGGEKFAFYNGSSQEITVKPGENSLTLVMKKDEGALSSRFYVSQDGDDEEGDGSYSKPFKTISKAAGLFSDTTKDYTIVVMGSLSGEQRLPKPSNVSGQTEDVFRTASSITLLGIDSSSCLDGSFSSNNAGTTLSITSVDPVIIKCLKITGGYSSEESSAGGVVIGNGDYTSDVTFSRGVVITGNTSTAKNSGGGVFLAASSRLTFEENAEVSDCKSTYTDSFSGGGIYSKGTLVMQGSSNIQNCNASYAGGAISLSGGTVTMNETSFIKGCMAKSGAGVFVCGGGNFIMNGSSSISGCQASVCGGAVYINDTTYNGTFTLNSGTLEENSAKNGGGVYIATWGNIIMSGGSIKNNTVSESGAGVYLASGGRNYLFTGGTIGGNSFEENNNVHAGSGIYTVSNAQNFFITLGGTFKVLSDNDINIGSSTSGISIVSPFINSSVATISLGSYSSGRELLKLADNATTTLEAEYQKFTISPYTNGNGQTTYWILDSEGKVQEQ